MIHHNIRHVSLQIKYFYVALGYEQNGFIDKGRFIDEKMYLSGKNRKCNFFKAAKFNNSTEARHFYDAWARKQKDKCWRLDLVECVELERFPITLYDDSHPYSLALENAPKASIKFAGAYFDNYLDRIKTGYSENTIKKHRLALLPFGFDIQEPLPDKFNFEILLKKAREDLIANGGLNVWDGEFEASAAKLTLASK